jgi:DNA-binding MarR family transcriptional regulator
MQDRPELDHAIAALQRLSELFQTRRRQLAEEVGITESQWRVLEEIADEHFMPSLFARERQRTPAAISRTLRALADKRLVEASLGSDDARRRIYRLTTRGRNLQRDLRARRRVAIAEIWSDFSARDLRAFVRFAGALGDRLEAYTRRE